MLGFLHSPAKNGFSPFNLSVRPLDKFHFDANFSNSLPLGDRISCISTSACFQESRTLRRWLNIATGSALAFITIVGIWKANPETLKSQPFLLDGSNGVSSIHSMYTRYLLTYQFTYLGIYRFI